VVYARENIYTQRTKVSGPERGKGKGDRERVKYKDKGDARGKRKERRGRDKGAREGVFAVEICPSIAKTEKACYD